MTRKPRSHVKILIYRTWAIGSLRGVWKGLALDNVEWSQIGHLMNFTQRIISIMERDWNVEWG